MKVFKITEKNLKLLMRSKTSMFVVIFGPLLIMLLVGFAFNNPTASNLNIGYFAKEKTNLTSSFLDALQANKNFNIVEFNNPDTCKDMIAQGKIHMCIVFPDNFVIANNKTNELIFYVDQSRTNFVYEVIDTVSSKISFTSNKLSYQMTNDLVSVIDFTRQSNSQNIAKIITLKNSLADMSSKLKDVQTKLDSMDLSSGNIDAQPVTDKTSAISSDVSDLKDTALNVVDTGRNLVTNLQPYVSGSNGTSMLSNFGTSMTNYSSSIKSASNITQSDISDLGTLVDSLSTQIDDLNTRLDYARTTVSNSSGKITDIQSNLNDLKTSVDALKSIIESTNSQISSLKVTSADSIVNPIKTTVTPINTKSNNLNFIFPYLIILIIVFISIMLSSSIILVEKTSKAYFRNFTTPTKDITFIASIFLTSLFVVIVQLIFILLLAYYFLNTSILSSVNLTVLLIIGSITLFTMIGMIIGYLFSSQEAATMASISVGSVFLFLSNLILPLETMSPYIQSAARYNPYVISSELLKKLTLFNAHWNDVYFDFAILGAYIVIALILVLIAQKTSKFQYLEKKPKSKQVIKKDDIVDKYFKLKNGVFIKDSKELLDELKKMSDATFQEYVDNKKNDFETWLITNQSHDLAKKVGKSRTRKEMIDILEKNFKK